jgi:putative ABC transport system permease protein
MKFLVLIVRNMMRQARRTLLTALTIAVATLAFAMLAAVPSSMDRIIASAARGQRLFVTNRAGPYGLPAKDCLEIKKLAHVTGCAAEWDVFFLYRNDSDWIGAVAADPVILDLTPDMPNSPADVARFRREKRSAAVGAQAMRRYGWHVGQQIMLRFPFNGAILTTMQFIIAGEIPNKQYPNVFLIRRDYLTDTLKAAGQPRLEGVATRMIVRVDTAENVGQTARLIDETFHNSDSETRSQTESEFLANGLSNIGNIRAIIVSLIAVVLVTVMLISGNSMAMTVRDRIPEVALLRTLGFRTARIAGLLFGEAIVLGAAGGALGAGTALALFAAGIDLGAITRGLGLISVSPAVALASFVAAIAVSVVSGTVPVAGALRIAPAIALRKIV